MAGASRRLRRQNQNTVITEDLEQTASGGVSSSCQGGEPQNRTPIAETGEAAEVAQVRANSPCSRTPLANGSATVTTLLHPGTELQEEPEEAAINEGNLEAHLAGSGSSTPPSEETLHVRVSAVPRQSESQVAHDSWGTSGRPSSSQT